METTRKLVRCAGNSEKRNAFSFYAAERVRVLASGQCVITLSNYCSFTWVKQMGTWMRVGDNLFSRSSFASRLPASEHGEMPLASVQVTLFADAYQLLTCTHKLGISTEGSLRRGGGFCATAHQRYTPKHRDNVAFGGMKSDTGGLFEKSLTPYYHHHTEPTGCRAGIRVTN